MSPTLRPGVLFLGSGLITAKAGHIVVIKRKPLSIKRIKSLDTDGVWVEGDNKSASTDSRIYGPVKREQIEAIIFFRVVSR